MKNHTNNTAEDVLNGIAAIILVVGGIFSAIFGIYLTSEFGSALGLLYGILTFLSCITVWSIFKILINISLTLKEINKSKELESESTEKKDI